jgi:hypothetical protein
VRIALTGETRKAFAQRLQAAYGNHASRLIRRIHALLWLGARKSVWEVAQLLRMGEQAMRDWLHAFPLNGEASLFSRARSGRPPKRTARQRQELRDLLVVGPEEAGYTSACGTAGMIADLIHLACPLKNALGCGK